MSTASLHAQAQAQAHYNHANNTQSHKHSHTKTSPHRAHSAPITSSHSMHTHASHPQAQQSSSPSHAHLTPKFQIGSAHGRMNYRNTEKVFHETDQYPHATQARQQVLSQLNLSSSARAGLWNQSTFSGPDKNGKIRNAWDPSQSKHPWLAATRKIEESRLAKPTQRVVTTALDRSQIWTEGLTLKDGSTQLWNTSTFFHTKELKDIGPAEETFDLTSRQSLLQRETLFLETQRAQREISRRHAEFTSASQIVPESNAYKFEFAKTIHPLDTHDEHEQALKETYTPQVLTTYLTRLANNQSFQLPPRPSTSSKRDSSSQNHHTHSAEGEHESAPSPVASSAPTPLSSFASDADHEYDSDTAEAPRSSSPSNSRPSFPSLTNNGLRSAMLSSTAPNIIKKYEHLGAWGYNQIEKCHVWSCCLNSVKSSRGCSVKITNTDRWNL